MNPYFHLNINTQFKHFPYAHHKFYKATEFYNQTSQKQECLKNSKLTQWKLFDF